MKALNHTPHPLAAFFKNDIARTRRRHADRVKTIRNYWYLRSRGFTRRAAWFNALNVL